jgi:hypothetical protein
MSNSDIRVVPGPANYNIISLYLMLFTQLSASGGYEKFVKSED